MAVIDRDMSMPEDCYGCEKQNCTKRQSRVDGKGRPSGCPLRSGDEIVKFLKQYIQDGQLRNRKIRHYRKQMRAVAVEVGDSHFELSSKHYPWYYEEDYPTDMEETVKKDNPFGGWYSYEVEERYLSEQEGE